MKPAERKAALEAAKLYLVAPGEFPVDVLREAIAAGIDVVQLRIKDAEAAEVLEVGDIWMGVCEDAKVPFIVNDRPDIALALAADGVHLGQDDLPPIVAREVLGPDVIIGRSTHSDSDIDEAIREHSDGIADYIAVGPIHATPTKPGRAGTGLALATSAASRVAFPWFGIGGIDPTNIASVVGGGVTRIVVVRAITEVDDPVGAVEMLRAALP